MKFYFVAVYNGTLEEGPFGWLSPYGIFFPCGFTDHYETAKEIINETASLEEKNLLKEMSADMLLERLGWVRLSEGYITIKEPTNNQLDFILMHADYWNDIKEGQAYCVPWTLSLHALYFKYWPAQELVGGLL